MNIDPRPLVVGHRANSVPVVANFARLGADWIEVDVRMGERDPVASHDEAERGAPSLRAVLHAAKGMGVNVEVKGPPAEPSMLLGAVAECLEAWDGPLLISSFWPDLLRAATRAVPQAPLGILTASDYDQDGSLAERLGDELGVSALVLENRSLSAAVIERAAGSGRQVWAWTVNDPARIAELARAGVAAVITDRVDEAVEALKGLTSK